MAEGTDLDAPIVAVTVFRDGARVQRSGTVGVEPGRQMVVIRGLPASVDPASVRVAARGPDLALLNVEVHHGYRTDPLREETARLRAEVDRCRDAVQAADDEDAAVQARLEFLGHLSGAAASALARAVGFGRVGHDELTQMALIRPPVTVRTSMVRIATSRPVGATGPRGEANGPTCRPRMTNATTTRSGVSTVSRMSMPRPSNACCSDLARAASSVRLIAAPLTTTGSVYTWPKAASGSSRASTGCVHSGSRRFRRSVMPTSLLGRGRPGQGLAHR